MPLADFILKKSTQKSFSSIWGKIETNIMATKNRHKSE